MLNPQARPIYHLHTSPEQGWRAFFNGAFHACAMLSLTHVMQAQARGYNTSESWREVQGIACSSKAGVSGSLHSWRKKLASLRRIS